MSSTLQTSRVRNQKLLPGVGDFDECGVASDEMAVHAVAPWLSLPGAIAYRAAAGNVDDPNASDGLTLAQSVAAIRKLYPLLAIEVHYDKPGWIGATALLATIRTRATAASVSVLGSALPSRLRFGYDGRHRIAIGWDGTRYLVGQPLNTAEHPWLEATAAELVAAITPYPGDGLGGAIIMPAPVDALKTHPLYPKVDNSAELEQIASLTAELDEAHGRIAAGIRDLSGTAPA